MEMFNSSQITPGTEFMMDFCKHLDFFVKYKLNTDPFYQ